MNFKTKFDVCSFEKKSSCKISVKKPKGKTDVILSLVIFFK